MPFPTDSKDAAGRQPRFRLAEYRRSEGPHVKEELPVQGRNLSLSSGASG